MIKTEYFCYIILLYPLSHFLSLLIIKLSTFPPRSDQYKGNAVVLVWSTVVFVTVTHCICDFSRLYLWKINNTDVQIGSLKVCASDHNVNITDFTGKTQNQGENLDYLCLVLLHIYSYLHIGGGKFQMNHNRLIQCQRFLEYVLTISTTFLL